MRKRIFLSPPWVGADERRLVAQAFDSGYVAPCGPMVDAFDRWIFDESRKEGDVEIVETEYGYHVMYFEGSKSVAWDDAVREAIAHPPCGGTLAG